ncbi:MAG: hypothetical protein LKJ69_04985 [Lactobacillus sp.]|jgi:hypothetical protein|nr:hypothetical protein [Lactobacillus sp.]MCI2032739.1 hypothetical protein [Lactobacillus sp.]
MTKLNVKIQTRRRTLLIVQAIFALTLVVWFCYWQAVNAESVRRFGDLVRQAASIGRIHMGWLSWRSVRLWLVGVLVLAITVAGLRLTMFKVITSTTQPRWFWGWFALGGVLSLTMVVAALWNFAGVLWGTSPNTWTITAGISAWACAGDFVCTLLARPQLVTPS